MKKVYISGAITGVKNFEKNFKDAENILTKEGYQAVNPVTLNHDHGQTWEEFMKVDLKALLDCDLIYMLDNWDLSRGANIERSIARTCGIKELVL